MRNDVECPYCGSDQEICHDDGYGVEEGEMYEHECSHCNMTFSFTTSISFYYDAYKAPCLNGGKHELKKVIHSPDLWPDWVRCKNCSFESRGEVDKERSDDYFKELNTEPIIFNEV